MKVLGSLSLLLMFAVPTLGTPPCFDYSTVDFARTDSDSLDFVGSTMFRVGGSLWVVAHDGHVATRFSSPTPGVLVEEGTFTPPDSGTKLSGNALALVGAVRVGIDSIRVSTWSPTPPHDLLGDTIVPARSVESLAVAGNVAAFVSGNGDPRIVQVDLSDPASPALTGTAPLTAQGTVVTNGHWAFTGRWSAQVQLFELDSNAGPQEVPLPTMVGEPRAWIDDLLLLQDSSWDVSAPEAPTRVGSLPPSSCAVGRLDGEFRSFARLGTHLVTDGRFSVLTWQDNLQLRSSWPQGSGPVLSLAELRGHVVAAVGRELVTLEPRDPSLRLEGRVPVPFVCDPEYVVNSEVWDVDAHDGLLSSLMYCDSYFGYGYSAYPVVGEQAGCDMTPYTELMAVEEPGVGRADASPTYVATVEGATFGARNRITQEGTSGLNWFAGGVDVQIRDPYAYVPTKFGKIRTLDLTDASAPAQVDETPLTGEPSEMVLEGNHLYLASDHGVQVYELAGPTDPTFRFREAPGVIRDRLDVADGRLVALEKTAGLLHAYDVTDPNVPVPLGTAAVGGAAVDVAVENGTAYVAAGPNLLAFDVSQQQGPIPIGTVTFPFDFFGIATDDEHLYVAERTYQLSAYPLHCPGVPPTDAPELAPAGGGSIVPNPFHTSTRIEFDAAHAGPVQLEIFDVRGRRVRRLNLDAPAPGGQAIWWDGRSEDGSPVAAGIYFVRQPSEPGRPARRIVRLR